VAGVVRLRDERIRRRVELENVTFTDEVKLEDIHFTHTLSLVGCHFTKGLVLDGAVIDGSLDLRRSRVGRLPPAVAPRWRDVSEVALSGVHVRVAAHVDFDGLVVLGTAFLAEFDVGGRADFSGVTVTQDLDLHNSKFGADLLCRRTDETAAVTYIGRNVLLRGATIAGQVDFCGAVIDGELRLMNAKLSADLHCNNWNNSAKLTPVLGAVLLMGAEIKGRVDFQKARIKRNVCLDGCTCNDRTVFLGADLSGVNFTAVRATFDDGLFLGEHGEDLNASFLTVGPTKCSSIDLQHTRVGGVLHLEKTVLESEKITPFVNLSFVTVDGACRLPGNDPAKKLLLYHAQLGELSFGDGGLPKVTADGLRFRELALPGNDYIDFLDKTDEFQEGNYRTVETHLRDRGQDAEANLVYREMRRRDRREEVGGVLFALELGIGWVMSLRQLYCKDRPERDKLRAKWRSWPKRRLPHGNPVTDAVWLFRWLALPVILAWVVWGKLPGRLYAADGERRARLREQRDHRAARQTELREQKADRADHCPHQGWLNLLVRPVKWLWSLFLDVSIGYGTASIRVGLYLVAVFLAFTGVFWHEHSVKRKYGAGVESLAQMQRDRKEPEVRPSEVGKTWRALDAMAMAARVTIPLVEPAVDSDWEPSSQSVLLWKEDGWVDDYTSFENVAGLFRVASFLAVPLFLVSLSGYMKQRGE
jgi:hypothetical protein